MSTFLITLICLLVLFISKRWLTSLLSQLIHHLGGTRHTLIILWSLIFLPGTIIHELSHFLFAILTGARTGKIEVLPEYLIDQENNSSVALGYVQTQKLNPIQGFFVGLAPFFIGLPLLIFLVPQMPNNLLADYLFFTVANSFYPSRSDIRQIFPLVIALISLVILLTLMGFRLFYNLNPNILVFLNTANTALFLSITINMLLIISFSVIKYYFYER